ncbi:MAG: N-acetyltransferase [Anaerovibrio sp.]|uniref:N-acetyltransferase n=1 Tax=Anaerovibrio sp. TaxID=1872532 RepID=UPI001B2A57D9|nr:N-acetyltransferase [Anaerovibrio sp.]MBO6245516.1 N-acetyltransferase [Anaerovibrio sp.]
MAGFSLVKLNDVIDELGDEQTKAFLQGYYCPYNRDVENFLRDKAVEFEKQGISRTHLVFASYNGAQVLTGYFTLANKHFHIDSKKGHGKLSSNLRARIKRFGEYDAELKKYVINAPLIAQLGKNFAAPIHSFISGDELLKFALGQVKIAQGILGGKVVYVECEDSSKLIDFYSRNGFFQFNTRKLESDEEAFFEGKTLVQMLRYLK